MKIYYIKFNAQADINYLHLFAIYDLSTYSPETKAYDTINYTSMAKLADMLPFSSSTLNRIISNDAYKDYLSIDKKNKVIKLNSSVIEGSGIKSFVRLTEKEVSFLRMVNDNLLCKYYVYMKYYCSLSEMSGKEQDYTAKQFLSAIGYSLNSQSQIDKISNYNKILQDRGLIEIKHYRDELGHTRNIYKIKCI